MTTISAVISPTGRNASVKTMPNAITTPDIRPRNTPIAAVRSRPSWYRTAQAARAQAEVESNG